MKRNNISNVIKLLILAAGIVLTCILIAIGFYLGRSGKSYVNSGTNQYAKMMSDYDNLDITMYDGLEVPGKELKLFIESFQDASVQIKVYTTQNLLNPTLTPKTYISTDNVVITDKLSANYINPSSTFVGKVSRNENGIVYLIEFTQSK